MRRALVLVGLLLLSADALARVGGGEGYSGGGSYGGGGGSYGGGGGDIDSGLVYLLLHLIIEAPAIGIPVTVVVLGVVFYAKRQGGGTTWTAHGHQHPPRRGPHRHRPGAPMHARPADLTKTLTGLDANFSLPLFLDWVNLVYVRGHDAGAKKDSARLAEHFSPAAQDQLAQQTAGVEGVRDIIIGSARIVGVRPEGGKNHVEVVFEANITEKRAQETTFLVNERWVFGRNAGVLSPGPDKLRTLGCPSCGSTLDPKTDGRCPSCDTLRTGGQTQWQVERIQLLSKKAITPPTLEASGVEAGTALPTRFDGDLPVERRKFDARHPDHDWAAFKRRVEEVFRRLQSAWDAGRWEDARPFETDALFQQHRFWMERYRLFGLRNRLEDVGLEKIDIARIATDAFYESVTVRIHATMKDWTIRTSDGRVMAGDPDKTRRFTEYWSFIRTIGTRTEPRNEFDANHCPSCGAPLDKVSMAGVCGYCDAKIVTGDFDWVLSRIEQDEAYEG